MRIWSRLSAAILAACLFAGMSSTASAQFYVRSPEVERGETEIEEHGAVYWGPGEEERLRQTHELEFKSGLTDRFEIIVEGFFKEPLGENLAATELEIGGQYELVQRAGDGFALAFRTIYEFALEEDSPDEILFGPLARYVSGHTSTTLNTFFVGQLGDDTDIDSLEFKYNWQLKRELGHRVGIGIEAFGEIEDLAHAGSFNDQKHRVGPVFYLKPWGTSEEHELGPAGPEFKLAAGTLFGVTDATSDITFKFDLEIEF